MHILAFQIPLLGFASALGVSLNAFSDSSCGADGGQVLMNVFSNQADVVGSSNCQTAGTFNSVNVGQLDAGFVCNIYGDGLCQNFIETIREQVCSPVIGQGVLCFCDSCFGNPFALSKAEVTIGQNIVLGTGGPLLAPAVQGLDAQIQTTVDQACSASGCDPTNPFTQEFFTVDDCGDPRQCGQTCSQSWSVSGNFDDVNQREYMRTLLVAAMKQANSMTGSPTLRSGEDVLKNVITFAQVVINDQNGNNQAEMDIKISVKCDAAGSTLDCGGTVPTLISNALSVVPEFGGVLAAGFNVGCTLAAL